VDVGEERLRRRRAPERIHRRGDGLQHHGAKVTAHGLREARVLFDFNPLAFEERRAPY
jgi:hypothetical protein